jgi:O-methyltransferase involved in polyketide biosynthesis
MSDESDPTQQSGVLRNTASWLTNHGWVTDSLDSRSEMARLGRPIPAEFIDTAPASSLVTAVMRERGTSD